MGMTKSELLRELITLSFWYLQKTCHFFKFHWSVLFILNKIKNEGEDIYIPMEFVGTAFHGDKVQVEILKRSDHSSGRRREGRIKKIIERTRDTIVGTLSLPLEIPLAIQTLEQ